MSTAEKLKPAVQIKLKVLKGPHQGQSFHLSKTVFTVGRGPENEVVLINDPLISRQHVRLQVSGQDIEIINLSQKNKLLVGSEVVQRWKLINDSTFVLGDTEIQINYDLGQNVAIVPAAAVTTPMAPITSMVPPPTPLVPTAPKSVAPRSTAVASTTSATPQVRAQNLAPRQPVGGPMQTGLGPQQRNSMRQVQEAGLLANPKARFYLILGIIVLGLVYWLNTDVPKAREPQQAKSTLRYEDEFLLKQNSQQEKELEQKRKAQLEQKNSPIALRIEENFQKGMRDFYLGNYTRALDFFQIVLNLDANHALAKRHSYLARVRFDELVKTKLALGESYYQKHNFKMCQAMYQQVMIMLQNRKTDLSYQIAERMTEKCNLAIEGIR